MDLCMTAAVSKILADQDYVAPTDLFVNLDLLT